MFRYYQTSEKTAWKIIKDSKGVEEEVLRAGGIKMTILALSEEIVDSTDKDQLKYKGPFYVDIDSKDDLAQAAKSVKELYNKLVDRDVPKEHIQLFASGSKGFHVIVHERIFTAGRGMRKLPKVYQEMALALYVKGMDLQVYSMGKGVSWRLENVQRSNGNYRIRVSLEDIDDVIDNGDVAYNDLVSQPQIDIKPPTSGYKKANGLIALFSRARAEAFKEVKQISPIEDTKLKEAFSDELPNCIVDIREGRHRQMVNFNQLCLTVASFVCRVGMSESDRNSLAARLAERVSSATYDSEYKRESHLQGLYKYVDTKPEYKFSCASARGKLSTKPCEGCKLNDGKGSGNQDVAIEDIGISILDGSYFRITKNDQVRLTTFTIAQATKLKGAMSDTNPALVTKAIKCDIVLRSGESHSRVIPESAWKSKSSFLSVLEGIEGAVFLGSDLDVQKIKYLVFEDEGSMDEITEVDTTGIMITRISSVPVPVYIEPSFSVNKYGVPDTHVLNREVPNPPHLTSIVIDETSKSSMQTALNSLMRINDKEVIAQILGWFSAVHLKAHIHYQFNQFPLLNLWGNAGAGKTRTAELFMWMSGAGSRHNAMSISLPHTTKFPLVNYVTSTTTIPRVLEEFNKARLNNLSYNYAHEIMKSAFNELTVSRGSLANSSANGKINAVTVELKVSSPLVYISEQPVESPPLRQRTVAVCMDSRGRDIGSKAFKKLEPIQHHLEPLAKMLTLRALRTTPKDAQVLVDSVDLSDLVGVENRPKFGMQVVIAGLQFLADTLEDAEMSVDTIAKVRSLYNYMIDNRDAWSIDIVSTASKTEVDQVLEDYALMAHLGQSNSSIEGLEENNHFYIDGDDLYLNLPICHSLYKRFKRMEGGQVIIDSPSQMMKLLKTEAYFISTAAVPGVLGAVAKRMVKLSLDKMRRKEIEVSLFLEE